MVMILATTAFAIWALWLVGYAAYKIGYLKGDAKGWDRCFADWTREAEIRAIELKKQQAQAQQMAVKALTPDQRDKILEDFENSLLVPKPKPKYTKQEILKKFRA